MPRYFKSYVARRRWNSRNRSTDWFDFFPPSLSLLGHGMTKRSGAPHAHVSSKREIERVQLRGGFFILFFCRMFFLKVYYYYYYYYFKVIKKFVYLFPFDSPRSNCHLLNLWASQLILQKFNPPQVWQQLELLNIFVCLEEFEEFLPGEILNFEVQNADSNFGISFDLNRKEALFESKSWKVQLKIILNSAFQKFLDMRTWVCQKWSISEIPKAKHSSSSFIFFFLCIIQWRFVTSSHKHTQGGKNHIHIQGRYLPGI